jgi:hypothetical protein
MAEEEKVADGTQGIDVEIVLQRETGKKNYKIKLPSLPVAGEKMEVEGKTLTISKLTYKDDGKDFIPVIHFEPKV